MKKSYFAIGAIAAAMCSCSSESIPSAGEGNVLPGTEDLAPISLSMTGNNTSVEVGSRTRGTGTVGAGTAAEGFATGTDWRNEELYILMTSSNVRCLKDYNKFKDNPDARVDNPDIIIPAAGEGVDRTDETLWTGWGFTTLNGEGPWLRQQFNGAIWARPQWDGTLNNNAGGWKLTYNSTTDIKNNDWYLGAGVNRFYPINGVSDFFAFYVDDACKYQLVDGDPGYKAEDFFDYTTEESTAAGVAGNPLNDEDFILYKPSDDDSDYNYPAGPLDKHYPLITKDNVNRQMSIKFRIDGTQDLLAGNAERKAGYEDGFSAKSARRGITPDITMNHLLTRLTFDIYRGDKEANKIQITGIKIKSKDSGKLIVAYDVDNNPVDVDNLVKWGDTGGKYEGEEGFVQANLRKTYFTLKQAKVVNTDAEGNPILDGEGNPTTTTVTVGDYRDNVYNKETVAIDAKKNKLENLKPFNVSSITNWVGQDTDGAGTLAPLANCHKELGAAMFVAPGESKYTMILEYKVLVDDRVDDDGNIPNEGDDPTFNDPSDPVTPVEPGVAGDDLLENMEVTFDLKAPQVEADNNLFARGKSYNIKITVYGLRPILATATLEAWEKGNDIWVGGDNDDDSGLPDGVHVETDGSLAYD